MSYSRDKLFSNFFNSMTPNQKNILSDIGKNEIEKNKTRDIEERFNEVQRRINEKNAEIRSCVANQKHYSQLQFLAQENINNLSNFISLGEYDQTIESENSKQLTALFNKLNEYTSFIATCEKKIVELNNEILQLEATKLQLMDAYQKIEHPKPTIKKSPPPKRQKTTDQIADSQQSNSSTPKYP